MKLSQPKPTRHATQEMMREYRQLKQNQRAIEARIKEMRQVLLAARTFEEGSLTCIFENRTCRLFSYEAMEKFLDPMILTGILLNIDRPEYTAIWIEDTVPTAEEGGTRPGGTRG
jgi:hypothetical protein